MRIFGLNILTDFQVSKIRDSGWLRCKDFVSAVTLHQRAMLRDVIKPQKKYKKLYQEAIDFLDVILENRIDLKK